MHIDTVSIFFHGVPAVLESALLLSRSVFESSCTRCGELRNQGICSSRLVRTLQSGGQNVVRNMPG